MRLLYFGVIIIGIHLMSCSENQTLFTQLESSVTGVDFNNEIIESDSLNILLNQYLYNGGGVGVGDFNNDGLSDLYFTGNLVDNGMYLNKGNFRFENVTDESGTACKGIWSSGVSVVDLNADGWDDLYISATFHEDSLLRRNQLLINQGNNANGIPVFRDMAAVYGLDDNGYSVHTLFFDYDLDGDLDAYVLTNKLLLRRSASIQDRVIDGSSVTTDRLYQNNGQGKFIDVSDDAGIIYEGFGLGVSVLDVNEDGYPDLYVSNDFVTNDILYVNQKDGSFANEVKKYFAHQSFSSMGIDVGDINNDGLEDIMTLDMQPEDDERYKKMFGANQYQYFDIMESRGYESQVYRNSFQLNRGNQSFSEISQLLGVHATDWSWSVLFADFDNDMLSDIAITNGFPRDITDLDFINYRSGANRLLTINRAMLEQIPQVKLKNYFYKNLGNLQMEDVTDKWGIRQETFSNGAAFVDLDHDGDLDYIVNNINDPAQIFRNNTDGSTNYIRIELSGSNQNPDGFGSRVTIYLDSIIQEKLAIPYRGYISSVEKDLHFGLGNVSQIDSLIVIWPDLSRQKLVSVDVNQTLTIKKKDHLKAVSQFTIKNKPLFQDKTDDYELSFHHQDQQFFDFNIQKLLPHMHSNEGPGIAIGDINGDNKEDIVFGNGRSHEMTAYLQTTTGYAKKIIDDGLDSEDLGVLLFDADNDNDLDLYICSGSSEYPANSNLLQDRLLINYGNGDFRYERERLPEIFTASSSASAADYDKDGDLDLFVTGRILPQSYPLPVDSYILRNENGSFLKVNDEICPGLNNLGLATSAIWTDYNNDHWLDLIVVGEWMPVTVFQNMNGLLKNVTDSLNLSHTQGWWNTISGADLNGDGYTDYILGNQGLNNRINPSSERPIKVVAKDFDSNGSVDNLLFGYVDGELVPLHLLKDLKGQLLEMRKKFQRFEDYASANIEDVLSEDHLRNSYQAEVKTFESAILMNHQGSLEIKNLPVEAQFSPMYGIVAEDITGNGYPDLITVGNKYSTERNTGKHDASIGSVLEGKGDFQFQMVPPGKSGILVKGDSKSLVKLETPQGKFGLMAGRNNEQVILYELTDSGSDYQLIHPPKKCAYTVIIRSDGRNEKREVYRGSGYASASSNLIIVNKNIRSIQFFDGDGNPISRDDLL